MSPAEETDASVLREWTALTDLTRAALRGAVRCRVNGGWTIHGHGVSGGVVAGLRARGYLDCGSSLWARGVFVREIGLASEAPELGGKS